MNIASWNKETRQAYVGTLIYSIMGIVASLLGIAAIFSALSGGGTLLTILTIVAYLSVIGGYVMFFLAIKDLKEITEGAEQAAFKKIFISIIFSVVAAFLSMIPLSFVLRFIVGLCNIAAYILLLISYSALKRSEVIAGFSPEASHGFKTLFTAQLLLVIGVGINWIPVINFLGGILDIIAFILVILGWKKVATPIAEAGKAAEKQSTMDMVKGAVIDSIDEVKDTAIEVAAKTKETAKEVAEDTVEVAKEVADKAKGAVGAKKNKKK